MCVDKKDWSAFTADMNEKISQLMHDVKGVRNGQNGLALIQQDMQAHLKKLNNRTGKLESRADLLEDPEFRQFKCVHRDVIPNVLTVEKFEEWQRKQKEEQEKEERKKQQELENRLAKERIAASKAEARQRRNGWITTAIVGVGTLIMALMGILS